MRALPALLVLLTLTVGGCASAPVVHVAPVPVHPIPTGINDGWHTILPPEILATDCPAMIRVPQVSGAALGAFLTATPAGCPILALVETPDLRLVDEFARERPPAIELGNELELAPSELTPSQYGAWIRAAATVLRAADYQGTVVLGGVYAITSETKQAIRLGIAACIDVGLTCVAAVHLYNASDADLQWLRDLQWPVWVTEVGFPTRCDPARVPQQRDFLAVQIARFSTVPLLARAFLYVRSDGRTCSDLDTFGIDGKPAMDLLRP
jgi:hypothetical protein